MTQTSGIYVLYVDDEPEFAELAADMLEREDDRVAVETATSASEGLDRLAVDDFDCIVSDYDMPGQTGIEFLEAVREEYPDLPFILYTCKGSEEIASAAISAGITDYLEKEGGTSQYTVLANRIINAVEGYRSERSAKETKTKLSQLAEKTDDVLFMFDGDWSHLMFINSAYEDIWGGSIAELKANPSSFLDYIHPEDRDQARRSMERLANGQSDTVEYRVVPPDDEQRWVRGESKPILNDDGTVDRIVGYVRDITEQKEREQELQQTRNRMEFALNVTDSVVWDWNIEADQASFYPSEEPLYGKTIESLDDFMDVVHPDDRQQVREALEYSLEAGEPKQEEVRILRDGEVRWIEAPGKPVSDDGATRMVGVVRDITDRKENELELKRQNDRLDRFASVVSHDLRNPLNVASGNLELARQECDSEHLDDVARAHGRMETLIDDLLTLTRQGDSVDEPEPVALANIIDRCWQTIETVDARLVAETERTIQADPDRLKQLLENLFRNAIEHTDGDVTVTVGGLNDSDGFYIADNGSGIPPDKRDEVFEARYSTVDEGTGLGLNIVREIAEAHNWEIRVTESESGGARFEIIDVEVVDE